MTDDNKITNISEHPPIDFAPEDPKACQHRGTWLVDLKRPVVTCALCDLQLDVWWCMRQMAEGYRRTKWQLEEIRLQEDNRVKRNERARDRRVAKQDKRRAAAEESAKVAADVTSPEEALKYIREVTLGKGKRAKGTNGGE